PSGARALNMAAVHAFVIFFLWSTVDVVAPTEFNCTFDAGYCGWIEGTLGWIGTLQRGNNRTIAGTGPSADHTSGSGYYVYLDTSTRNGGYLESPDISSGTHCMTFWYHMYGPHVGRLEIYDGDGSIWRMTGDQGDNWLWANVTLDTQTWVDFYFYPGNGALGVIAIDDVSLADGSCTDFDCTFDAGYCGWSNYGKLQRGNKRTVNGTGPSADHTSESGYFVYNTGEFGYLRSPDIDNPSGTHCMTFWYHMYGPHVGRLEIFSGGWTIWSMTGDQGDNWLWANVTLDTQTTWVYFEFYPGNGSLGVIAIDDVSLANGSCTGIVDAEYADFQNPDVIKCFWPEVPWCKECREGLADKGLLFFIGTPISFKVTTQNKAAADHYEFRAVHSDEGKLTEVNLTPTTNPFTVNKLSKAGLWNITITAVNPMFQATISSSVTMVEHFEITHNEKKMEPNIAKTFEVLFKVQGLQTCLTIDFGDNSSVEVYADNSSYCGQQAAYAGFTLDGALTGLKEVNHVYQQDGYYEVTAIARSLYNIVTKHLHLNINSHGGYVPKVTIENAAHLFHEPRVWKREDIIKFRAIPSFECERSDNTKTWVVHEIDVNWGNVTAPVNLTGKNVYNGELRLDPWTLDLKLYRVSFKVTLTGYGDKFRLTGSDYSYFQVVQSALVGIMINGGTTEVVQGVGVPLHLTPLSFSFDASVLNNDPRASFYEQHSSLTQGYTYSFTAILQKDSRSTMASLHVVVLDGLPPKLTLECAGGSVCHQLPNGKLAVLKSARLGLRAKCIENCGAQTGSYSWNISLCDTGGWWPLQHEDMVTNARTLGYESQSSEMAVYPSLFEAFASTTHYRVECAMTVIDTNGKRQDGWAAIHFQLNTPPRGGNCTIEPKEMVATMKKLFRIQSYHDNTSVPLQITWVMTSKSDVDINVTIGRGPKHLDYYNSVLVIVRDTMGASTTYKIGAVRVTPSLEDTHEWEKALKKMSAEGDVISLTELVAVIANSLNQDKLDGGPNYAGGEDTATQSSLTDQEALELREQALEAFTTMPLNDVMSMDQILSTMMEILRIPDEITNRAQMTVMNILSKMAEKLEDVEQLTSEERMKNLKYMIATAGSCLASTQLFESGREIMGRIVSSFRNNSIIGESQQFNTNHQNARLTLMKAEHILRKSITLDGSNVSAEFPADVFSEGENDTLVLEPLATVVRVADHAAVLGKECSSVGHVMTRFRDLSVSGFLKTPGTIELQLIENVNTPLRYTPGAKHLATNTSFVTVNIQWDDSGQQVTLANPLKVWIPRGERQTRPESMRVDANTSPWKTFMIHRTEVRMSGSSLHVTLCVETADVGLAVLVSLGDPPNHLTGHYPKQPACSNVMLDNEQLADYLGPAYVGVRQLLPNETDLDLLDCTQLPAYWGNGTPDTLFTTNYSIKIFTSGCYVWSEERKDWSSEGLRVGLAPLEDNNPRHKYFYKINVTTGMRRKAGTKSKVFFKLIGEEEDSDIRQFTDSKRDIFQRSSTDGFLMATPGPLGHLQCVHIWHDNSGGGDWASWYLDHMTIQDIQTGERWMFIANTWLAVEKGNGKVNRIIHSATRQEMAEFFQGVKLRSRQNLKDEHLWYSVISRPPQSRFTRVQRVCCCLCVLLTTMLANAMFYKTDDDARVVNEAFVLQVGPFTLSPQQVFIGRSAGQPWSETDCEANMEPVADVSQSASPGLVLAKDGKKKTWSLPWWCRVVAWILWAVTCLVSAAFVTFYGIQFEDATCREWITSLLISFFTSVFVLQPIKIFLLAVLQVLILKKTDDEFDDLEVEPTRFAGDELPLHTDTKQSCGSAATESHNTPKRKPLKGSALRAARERRLKEIQKWRVLRDVITHVIFLAILLYLAHRDRTQNMFLYKDTLHRVFIKNNQADFDKVSNTREFWEWTRSGLVNGVRAGPYYNHLPPFLLRGFVNDKVSKILGYATMRQVRVKPGECNVLEMMTEIVKECNTAYSVFDQEEDDFDIGWKQRTVNSTVNSTAEWYNYMSADELGSYPYWGQLAVYGGGGYVVRLQGSRSDLLDLMARLETEMWVDRYTRAVFIEFTTYNAQVNLFSIARILAEFHPTGGIVPSYRFEPAKLLPYGASVYYTHLTLEILLCCFILFLTIRLMARLTKQRMAFLRGFWNIIELCIITMSWSAVVVYFFRLFEMQKRTAEVKETQGLGYVSFQYVAYWHEVLGYLVGWAVFFATVKFLKLLRFNRRISLFAATLKECSGALLNFSLVFWVVFLSFDMLFFLIYMTIDDRYSSFMGSAVANTLMIMGKFTTYDMMMADPLLTT
ncbi:hypothetical protein BaRGS_00006372, partial [Batillaria attramentaria]